MSELKKPQFAKVRAFSFEVANKVSDSVQVPFITGFVLIEGKQCYVSLPLALVKFEELT